MNKRNVKYKLTIITLLVIMGCMLSRNVFAALPQARSAEVSGEVFLGGDYLEIGISSSGSFGTDGNVPDGFHKTTYTDMMMTEIERNNLGLSIDKDGFDIGNPPTTGDFFLPANPIEGFMIGYYTGGEIGEGVKNIKKNINYSPSRLIDIPSTTTDISSGNLLSSQTVGVTNDGKIKNTQIISFNKSDKFYKTTVTLENVSDSDLYDIRYSRCVDPDQDADKNGAYTTNNEVIDNSDVNGKALVSAVGPVTGEAFFYLSTDSRARAAITGTSIYDPYDATIYADDGSTLIGTANGHHWITITFSIGNLAVGESASFVYYSSLNPDAQAGITEIENVLPVDNEAPTISTNNGLTLNEGATKAITTTELSATDVDTDDTTLTYTITTGLSNGQLENTDNPGTPIASFTQQNLIDGKIQYVHDGSNTTSDSFVFKVADGTPNQLTGQTFNITVNPIDDETPTIAINNGLTLNEGATKAITTTELSATDVDTDDTALTYTITTGLSNGQLENTDNPGTPIASFTQQNLIDGKIQYVHDGSNTTSDSFVFKVADGTPNQLTGQTFNITVNPIDDETPTIAINNGLTLNEGATKAITTTELSATDVDTDDTTLTYTITTGLSNGQLENTDNPGTPIVSFTQQNLIDGKIQYVHDGSNTTSDSFVFKVADGTPNELTGQTFNITVNAIYIVNFKDYNGTVLKTEEVEGNTGATPPVDPIREGYTFISWDKDFSNLTSDLTVTAQYNINQYTVSFNSNGGSEVPSQTLDYNSIVTEPTAPTKEGYTFRGWYKEAELIEPWDFSIERIPAEDIVLYAKWLTPQDSITMIAIPNSIEFTEELNQLFTLNLSNDTVVGHVYKSDLSLGGVFSSLRIEAIDNSETTVTAKVYGNLSSEGIGTITLNEDKLLNRLSQLSADITVISRSTYDVSYNDNGATSGTVPVDSGNYEQGDTVEINGNTGSLVKTGYLFTGWNTKADGTGVDYGGGDTFSIGSSNIVLYAKWNIKEYTVTFKDYDGTILKTQTVEHGNQAKAPANPTREGYTFTDWDIDFTNVALNLIVTAQYNINNYTVSFESNGGSEVSPITAEYNNKITQPVQPTKSGYRFKGWYENEALTQVFDFNTPIVDDIILYAKWERIESYNDNDNDNDDDTESDQQQNVAKKRTIIIINGQEEKAGEESVTEEEGKKVVEVKVDLEAVIKKIEEVVNKGTQENEENVVEIPVVTQEASKITTKLTGDIVKKMEESEFKLSIKSSDINYVMPAKEVGIESVAEKLGILKDKLQEIEVEVKINNVAEEIAKIIEETAKGNDYEVVFPPVEFNVVAKAKPSSGEEKVVTISKFSEYVKRAMEIPEGIDLSKITTGILYNEDGTFSHIPTTVYMENGKWYANLNSLTNSSYSVIWNPITVSSVENHWSKEAVNDMASRLIIKNPQGFVPDENITRGEFAEYITKALGIYRTKVARGDEFTDIDLTNKLVDAIEIATEYGIITGYPDGTFRSDAQISREEAMVMYLRAMDIAGLKEVDNNRIESYIDKNKIAAWAYDSVKKVLSAGVFNGKTNETIEPKATFTYAEAATVIRNLLTESRLINKK